MLTIKKNIQPFFFLNILLALYPLAYTLGNLAINLLTAVIIIFGVSTAIFSLIFTGYLYSLPPEQDTTFILKTSLVWINTVILIFVTFFFNKISSDLKKNYTNNIKKNLIYVGGLSYLFLFLQLILWYQLIIFLYIYSVTRYSSSGRFIFLGKSFFKNI